MFLSAMALMAEQSREAQTRQRPRRPSATQIQQADIPAHLLPQTQSHKPREQLPSYSANIEYEAATLPADVTRRAVKTHEKKIQRDLKSAKKVEEQCAKIKQILPDVYKQLTEAVEKSKIPKEVTGPAALRQPKNTVTVKFSCKGIDQDALRDYLPVLLADYQRQVQVEAASSSAQDAQTVLNTEEEVTETQSVPSRLNPDKMVVSASFFDDYVQKIYFTKKFADLFRKNEQGKRDNLFIGFAVVAVGLKIGLPLFDLFTFVGIDCPKLALQKMTGKQLLFIEK